LSQGGSRQITNAGIAATPTTGVLVRSREYAGGIQISASHNPAEYNGLKLFSHEGRVIPAVVGERVLARYGALEASSPTSIEHPISSIQHRETDLDSGAEDGPARWIQHPRSDIQELADTTSAHLALIESIVDVDRVRARRFRVVLDANHGSGSVLGRPLLEKLGCQIVLLGGEPDGLFAHQPEPTPENLGGVLAEVTRAAADIGFAQDPDADRLAIIDEGGRYIGEDYTLAMCVEHVLRHTPGPVVTNCSSSRMTEDIARKYGVPFFRSAVGEANVVDLMLRERAVIGGEGNGGVIDPRVGLVRDSFVGMALVLDAMVSRGRPISALAGELPRYAIHKAKANVGGDAVTSAFAALQQHFHEATSDRLDGLRLDFTHADGTSSWLLVRASNTEPIVRIIAEAPHAEEARRLCQEAAQVIAARTSA
jgi:phosphomannomutase